MTNTIHIIGLGVAVDAQLSNNAQEALQTADIIFGSERQLETIATVDVQADAEKKLLPLLSQLKKAVDALSHRTIAILASGDPLYYGIGRWANQQLTQQQLYFYPAVSSVQAACHQLGLSLQNVDVISLHGRPLVSMRSVLNAQQTLVILTDKNSQPQAIAQECVDAGFSQSLIWVCEKLGYPQQRVRQFSAEELIADTTSPETLTFDPLHVTVVNTQGRGGVLPEFPGIPDEHFSTGEAAGKGMISKREVRLAILSLLQTSNDDVLWDIGAGCGGVAVELALWSPRAAIYAIECHEKRLEHLAINRDRFGVVKNLHIVQGRAPDMLATLPAPTKIFIGGSDGELPALLPHVWSLLAMSGVLVVSAVTDNTRSIVNDFINTELHTSAMQDDVESVESVESVDIAVTRNKRYDGQWQEQKKLPVTLYRFKKY
jgi:precorrin-6Y C5,15-methyltransferase (decarboxylating)